MTSSVILDADTYSEGMSRLAARRQLSKDRQHAWADPKWFTNEYMGRPTFDKQDEIAESVKVNRRTAVKGSNSSGKDYESGNIINWWEFCWDDAITIVYGPVGRQVQDIVWREARRAFQGSKNWLPGYMYPVAAEYHIDQYRYAKGFSAKPGEKTGAGIQGYHSPHLLVIVTEAHAVDASEFEALMRLNPYRVLITGNTNVQAGEFFDAFESKTWLYNDITISAFDTPNIIAQDDSIVPGMIVQADIDECLQEYGEDHPEYLAKILAEFPDNLEDSVVSRRLLVDAVARGKEAEDASDDDVLPRASLSCDVARFGDDDTVVYRRQGRHNYLAWQVHGKDTMVIAGKLVTMAKEDEDVDTIIIDDTGLGGGVTDRVREVLRLEPIRGGTVRVIAFRGGARAKNKQRYVNAVTEAWIEAGRAFRPDKAGEDATITIDDNRRLRSELSARKYHIQSDTRLALEPKKDYKERVRK
ncbi:MAG: hypothetical protein V3S68_00740, partial [Dehalococcoidia bacterium]